MLGLVLLLGLAGGVFQFYQEWQATRDAVITRTDQSLTLVQGAASEASYQLNQDLAGQVVNSLADTDLIARAEQRDDFGEILAAAGPEDVPGAGPLAAWLFGDLEARKVALWREAGGGRQQVGLLTVHLSPKAVAAGFRRRMGLTLILGGLGVAGLTLLVTAVFWVMLTGPLVRLSHQIAAVDPAQPAAHRLPRPLGHRRDEVGLLVSNLNDLLEAFQKGLDSRDAAESALQALNRDLELRVQERTHDLETANTELATANHALESEKVQTEQAYARLDQTHRQLERANHLLLESLHYARRIQSAMLPYADALRPAMHDVAVNWEPLDVVGGDYYWMETIGGNSLIVVADCTGHGVPGAFMTLVVASTLDRILHEQDPIPGPAAILQALDEQVRARLRQDRPDADSDDGLEAAVCLWSPTERTLTFAGAGLPLLIYRDGEVSTIRGTRAVLAYQSLPPPRGLEEHVVPVAPGEAFFLVTDGVPEHMGGQPPRLLGRRRLAGLIADTGGQPMATQIKALEARLEAYRGTEPRRDDMTLIGFVPLAPEDAA